MEERESRFVCTASTTAAAWSSTDALLTLDSAALETREVELADKDMTKSTNSPGPRRHSTSSTSSSGSSGWSSHDHAAAAAADAARTAPSLNLHSTAEEKMSAGKPPAASLLKQLITKNHQQAITDEKQKGSPRSQQQKQNQDREGPQEEEEEQQLTHDGNNASIVLDEELTVDTPWTPKSLGRAKTAIIYKACTTPCLLQVYFFFMAWLTIAHLFFSSVRVHCAANAE